MKTYMTFLGMDDTIEEIKRIKIKYKYTGGLYMDISANILICDDNIAVHESLTAYLKSENMNVVSVYNGLAALEEIKRAKYDLIILDIMLPKMFGTEVCKQIRKESDVPIIILSARDDEIDKILGLELGADDYVTKPYSPKEVVTRVRTILRRTQPQSNKENSLLKRRELVINMNAYEVYVESEKIDLTPREVEVLYYLAKNSGIVLNREQILNAIWSYEYSGDTRAVDTQIKRIRQKMPDKKLHFSIKTIYGIGYIFEVKNEEITDREVV